MKMVKRLDRSREHFLTLLQLRARLAGLAITNVPNSRHCDIPPQEPQCPAPVPFPVWVHRVISAVGRRLLIFPRKRTLLGRRLRPVSCQKRKSPNLINRASPALYLFDGGSNDNGGGGSICGISSLKSGETRFGGSTQYVTRPGQYTRITCIATHGNAPQ